MFRSRLMGVIALLALLTVLSGAAAAGLAIHLQSEPSAHVQTLIQLFSDACRYGFFTLFAVLPLLLRGHGGDGGPSDGNCTKDE